MLVRPILAVLACAIAGSGPAATAPQEWMAGVFSTLGEGTSDEAHLQRIYLDAEGEFRQEYFESCGSEASIVRELMWEAVDENNVRISIPEEDQQGVQAVLLRRLPECDSFELGQELTSGVQSFGDPVYRGEICLTTLTCPEPEGGDCGCLRTYCDQPPAPLGCAED